MARSEQDLFTLQFSLVGTISLDWERIEQDSVFRTILATCEEPTTDADRQAVRAAALQEYCLHYVVRERFLREMPATNGPGSLTLTSIERLS